MAALNDKFKTTKIGGTTITRSRTKNPKTDKVQKSVYIQKKDGSTVTKTTEKTGGLKGVFDKKIKTTTRRSANSNPEDMITTTRYRKAGVLPRVKTTTKDRLTNEKDVKTNLFYKIGTKKERKKLKNDIRGEGERTKVKNCLKGCSANPLNK
jgi:pyruvate-formate lyase